MVHGENRIPYWIDRRLTGLAGPDFDATISFGLPFEPEDSQYGKSRMNMLLKFNGVFPLSLEIPDSLRKMEPIIKDMRDAFEHIDERAQGKINQRGKMDAEALTIFDQPDFIGSSVLHYRGEQLHFYEDVLGALLSCRGLVLKVIDLRADATN